MRLLAILLALAPTLAAQSGIDRVVPPVPTPAGFIHDGGPVLSAEALARLNASIGALQAGGRGDVGVAILRDLQDYPPYEVGTAIYRAWRIGSVDSIGSVRRDVGALLLIVPKELAPNGRGECWITTGRGAEGLITDATAGEICREAVIPHLRDRDYAAAVEAGINAIAARFTGGIPEGQMPPVAPPPGDGTGGGSPLGVIGGALGLLGLGGGGLVGWKRHRRRKPRPCPSGHGPMVRLDEAADDAALSSGQQKEESVKSVDYDVWECPTCRERLVLRYRRWLSGYGQCPACGFWTEKSSTRTVRRATTASTGLSETTVRCVQCGRKATTRRVIPMVSESSSSSSGGGGGGSSFGGSGSTSGGGGGSSY